MGGSSNYTIYGSGGLRNKCGDIFEFLVLFSDETGEQFTKIKVGLEIKLNLVKDKLPKLEVVALNDGMLIGLVPPSYSMLINCIENGWNYNGKIIRIDGDEIDPKIRVRIKGER